MKTFFIFFLITILPFNLTFAGSGATSLYDKSQEAYSNDIPKAVSIAEELVTRFPESKEAANILKVLPKWKLEIVANKIGKGFEGFSLETYDGSSKVIKDEDIGLLIEILEDYPDHKINEGTEAFIVYLLMINEMIPALHGANQKTERINQEKEDVASRDGSYDQMIWWRIEVMVKTLEGQINRFNAMTRTFHNCANILRKISLKHSLSNYFGEAADLFDQGANALNKMTPLFQELIAFYRSEGYNCTKAMNTYNTDGVWERYKLNSKKAECEEKQNEIKEKMAPIERELDAFNKRKEEFMSRGDSVFSEFKKSMEGALSDK